MKIDNKTIGYIKYFENTTKASVKGCFVGKEHELVFIVKEGHLWRAIGKKGVNIKKVAFKIGQKLRIIGFDKDPKQFVKNMLYPLDGYKISMEDNKIKIESESVKDKGKIYGRDRSNLKWMNEVLNKYFKGFEIIVG